VSRCHAFAIVIRARIATGRRAIAAGGRLVGQPRCDAWPDTLRIFDHPRSQTCAGCLVGYTFSLAVNCGGTVERKDELEWAKGVLNLEPGG
jgi:hypothetical protein